MPPTKTQFEEALQITSQLTLIEKVQLLEEIAKSLKHDIDIEAFKNIPWQQFVDITYGSLADDPIERNQPLMPDLRDEIE